MDLARERLSAVFTILSLFIKNLNIDHKSPTFLVIVASTGLLIYKNRRYIRNIMDALGTVGGDLTRGFRNSYKGSVFNKWGSRNPAQEATMLKRGGYVGGLINDGNTCFMNSVIQSLASSKSLMQFLDEELMEASKELENPNETSSAVEEEGNLGTNSELRNRSSSKKTYGKRKKRLTRNAEKDAALEDEGVNMEFSAALKELLEKLNDKYHRDKPYFKTNKLLKTMSKAPNKNIILGYDQEDAQEFFQTILSELEKNIKSLRGKSDKDNEPTELADIPENAMIGQERLGEMGTVYLPAEQIDPNCVLGHEAKQLFFPFDLVTPLDGITAERIGCLQCGENGGIRYSVFSGLSLNLPSDTVGSALKLSQLLREWVKPEIIEGVECNRCALKAVLEHLEKTLTQYEINDKVSEKLVSAVSSRVEELKAILAKPVVDDDDYKKLHTENMVRKCSKSKQILISRPPPLLSIHINRSVFDPRTYTIRKNNSRVLFKSRLNLAPWSCGPDEINLDARLPMSKKDQRAMESSEDENIGGEYFAKLHRRFEEEFEDSDEESDNYSEKNRLNSDYDPLKGELDSSSEDDEYSEGEYEIDSLGNRVFKCKNIQSDSDVNSVEEASEEDKPDTKDLENREITGGVEQENSDSEVESEDEVETQPTELNPLSAGQLAPSSSTVPSGPLTYALRSVIVHYGSHNYGHYIAFRKFRGLWWRISDETVYVVDEAEVLSTPGVFMLFYEHDYNQTLQKMNDDLEWEEQEEGIN